MLRGKYMKVYLIAYTRNNLGDDLFTKMLVSKYPDITFDINIKKIEHSESLKQFSNVNIINNPMNLDEINLEKYDAIVYIGGSIFIEKKDGVNKLEKFNKFIKNAKINNIPFFYISSNFGPYSSEEYLELAKDTFSYCEDVCFRDKYSYELFGEIESVRYAPDLILSSDIEITEKQKDTVGISIIDLSIRDDLKHIENKYLELLKSNIYNYQKEGKTVYLFSFCNYEGDEDTIRKLENLVEDKEHLKSIKYTGNIDEFLNVYSRMEYMLSSRFHSMILSAKLKQKVFVLSYSKKINNVIEDLNLPFNVKDFNDISEEDTIKLNEFKEIKELENLIGINELALSKLDKYIITYN